MATHCSVSWVRRRSRPAMRFCWLVGALPLSPAFGADAPQEGALEEIVVTATKREESLQSIPISVSAFSSDMIERLDFGVSYDIAAQVPNLQFIAESSPSTPFIFLRGIGNTSFFPNSINPVAVYVDNTYIGQSIAQGLQLFDLERVEVLRGPQGTLFGRNSTAGLVNFITRKPRVADGVNGKLDVTVGDYGQLDVQAAGGMPLGDRAAIRLAASRLSNTGMYDLVRPGLPEENFGSIDVNSFRGELLWQPSDAFEALLKAHYGKDESETTGEKPGYVVSPFGVPNCPPGAVSGALFNGCSDPFGYGQTVDPDFYDVQFTYAPEQDLESYGFMLDLTWDLGEHTIIAQTAWDSAQRDLQADDDANFLVFLADTFISDAEWFSQEIRVASNYDGRINWIGGLNYYSDDLNSQLNFAAPDLPPPPGLPPIGLGQDLQQKTESWAAFGELTWDFVEDWTLRLGLRLTEDERDVEMDAFMFQSLLVNYRELISTDQARAATLFPTIPRNKQTEDWSEWSGRAALDWNFAVDQLLYVSASRGFKGGEFNGGALLDISEATIADPEILDNYELGYKGSFLDRRLTFNITGFFMDYTDQQVLISSPTPFGFLPNLQNAGASEIKGFEFELYAQPTENWYLQIGGGYLDAEFTEFFDPTIGVDRAGNKLPHAPEWNFNAIVRYEAPLPNGSLGLQLDGWWLDDQYFTVENVESLREDAHGLLNARASYSFMNDRVELALFVRNLTGEEFVTTGYDTASAGFGAHVHVLNQPRTFGGQIILRYE
jgi:iron complex outermembrane receptor protein